MEPNRARRVVFQAAVVLPVVPAVLLLAFLDAVQGPADPYGDPNMSSPVTGLRLGLAAALVLLPACGAFPDAGRVCCTDR